METPPITVATDLRGYLIRVLGILELAVKSFKLDVLNAVPAKPVPGTIYCFKNATGIITKPGIWAYYTLIAGKFIVGNTYTVKVIGTTNFTLIGGVNTLGSTFVATGVGAGTGEASTWSFLG